MCVYMCVWRNDICLSRARDRVRRALDTDGFTDNKLSRGEMRFKVRIRSRVPIPIANLLPTLPDIWYSRSLLTPIKGPGPIVPRSEIISNDTSRPNPEMRSFESWNKRTIEFEFAFYLEDGIYETGPGGFA